MYIINIVVNDVHVYLTGFSPWYNRHGWQALKPSYVSALQGKEPEVTSYTDHAWMLDYIFFDTKTLLPLGVLSLVDKDIIAATGGLPSKEFPSDHLSLKSVFAFL